MGFTKAKAKAKAKASSCLSVVLYILVLLPVYKFMGSLILFWQSNSILSVCFTYTIILPKCLSTSPFPPLPFHALFSTYLYSLFSPSLSFSPASFVHSYHLVRLQFPSREPCTASTTPHPGTFFCWGVGGR
ncbi:hypothetical protein CC80DRAFT_7606 [Byssothecium circinans]|uniref:Uncharacterized protein n=1 Tax=Byssothecium circinans TaxID=147558 RepID=A0A6A5UI92_9PLEO|nr:hypothetical protein CC80DRAFT_7606 [Byssothecium circinans]